MVSDKYGFFIFCRRGLTFDCALHGTGIYQQYKVQETDASEAVPELWEGKRENLWAGGDGAYLYVL